MSEYNLITRNIEGWLHLPVMSFVEQINKIQEENNVVGSIAEIGVHHGKFFIPLALLDPNGTNIAIDLFDDQHENISQSGKGNLDVFLYHCQNFGLSSPKILKGNSLNMTPKQLTINNQLIRIISVDGGHLKHEVQNDLILATNCLHENGVIIVDDFQHPGWDDVFSTTIWFIVYSYYKPFLMGGNKLFLCRKDCDLYNNLQNTLTEEQYKATVLMQSEARQLLKTQTLLQLFPDTQLFAENQW